MKSVPPAAGGAYRPRMKEEAPCISRKSIPERISFVWTPEQDRQLCGEIREFLVKHIARTGGHLASNLGVVELHRGPP